ncbi:MAG TPA: hypothetical protein H9879_04150, partial [Candidatus Alistipes intestinipullorum]|nr:hypothetical protein [Candidatus Alistipes intestinipullorum]
FRFMKIRTPFVCLALLLAACGGPESRPISEELSLEEINTLLKRNPDYQEAISMAERFRITASTVDKARANDLSYEALQSFLDELSDNSVRGRLRKQADEKWTARYGKAAERIPGLIRHWSNYIDSLRPERYVSIRLISVDPQESTFGTARVRLEFVPTRGAIDRLKGRFGIFPRSKMHEFDDFNIARHNNYEFTQGLEAPTQISAWMHYSIWDIADGDIAYNMYPDRPGLPIEKLTEKYCFDYSVSELVMNGREVNYSEYYEQVPQSIRNYWGTVEEERRNREEELLGDIARELLMPDFVEQSRYVREYDEAYFRQRDSLAAWLVLDCGF